MSTKKKLTDVLARFKVKLDVEMRAQEDRYNEAVRARNEQEGTVASAAAAAAPDAHKKKPNGPRKKFEWNGELRTLMSDIVTLTMTCYKFDSMNLTESDYLKNFFIQHVVKFWPNGWMPINVLMNECISFLSGSAATAASVTPTVLKTPAAVSTPTGAPPLKTPKSNNNENSAKVVPMASAAPSAHPLTPSNVKAATNGNQHKSANTPMHMLSAGMKQPVGSKVSAKSVQSPSLASTHSHSHSLSQPPGAGVGVGAGANQMSPKSVPVHKSPSQPVRMSSQQSPTQLKPPRQTTNGGSGGSGSSSQQPIDLTASNALQANLKLMNSWNTAIPAFFDPNQFQEMFQILSSKLRLPIFI